MERSTVVGSAVEAARALRAGGFDAIVLEVSEPAEVDSLVESIGELSSPPPVVVARANGASDPKAELVMVDGVAGSKRLVARGSILYGRARGDYVRIVCADGRFLIHGRISEMERRWERFGFVRTHRCYVANIRHVRELRPNGNGTAWLLLRNGERIPVSRRRAANVRAALR
jgi:two-component system, LytTR family, response regulator